MKHLRLFALLVLVVVLLACGRGKAEIEPPDIRYGEAECLQCRMIISDPRFSAGYTYEVQAGRYENVPFDDIVDMLMYADQHSEYRTVAYWVHDFTTKGWIHAEDAYYVASDHLLTPMAFGIVAVGSQVAADELIAKYPGQILDWDGLLAFLDIMR